MIFSQKTSHASVPDLVALSVKYLDVGNVSSCFLFFLLNTFFIFLGNASYFSLFFLLLYMFCFFIPVLFFENKKGKNQGESYPMMTTLQ